MPDLASIPWGMAKTGPRMPAMLQALCVAAAGEVQDFPVPDLANIRWAMAKTGARMPAILKAL